MPSAWGAALSFYMYRTDVCMFFILGKIAQFLLVFGFGWMGIQVAVLIAACGKGNSWREMEAFLRAKHGVATDEQAVQTWRSSSSSSSLSVSGLDSDVGFESPSGEDSSLRHSLNTLSQEDW